MQTSLKTSPKFKESVLETIDPSSFCHMPFILVSTVDESGKTNLGTYSLCFPFHYKGEEMLVLVSKSDSNTAKNILRTQLATLNLIPEDPKLLQNCMELGFNGEATQDKMKKSIFSLAPSKRTIRQANTPYPEIVEEAVEVLECSWQKDYPYKVSDKEYHFLLKIEHASMKFHWKKALLKFGYGKDLLFWFTDHLNFYTDNITESKKAQLKAIYFHAQRSTKGVVWTTEACERLLNVPKIFLEKVINDIAAAAIKENQKEISPAFVDNYRKSILLKG